MKRHANYLSPYNNRNILDLQAARERREREANPPKYGPGIREAEEGYRRAIESQYAAWIAENVDKAYGKCREWSHAMVAFYPELRLARGWYDDPEWGARQHWWCVTADGRIVDPTAAQFPSRGVFGEYREIHDDSEVPTGICMNCGEPVWEGANACSDRCAREIAREYGSSTDAVSVCGQPVAPSRRPQTEIEVGPVYHWIQGGTECPSP